MSNLGLFENNFYTISASKLYVTEMRLNYQYIFDLKERFIVVHIVQIECLEFKPGNIKLNVHKLKWKE